MSTGFCLHGAVTAPGHRINEDAYGLWPHADNPQAAWVLDGVTGINDRPLLPGPSDAAWFVAQAQTLLPRILATRSDRPIDSLLSALVAELVQAQDQAWLNGKDADGCETPAASFALMRQIGDQVEFTRLGDCLVLLERRDGSIHLLDDPVLGEIESGLKAQILDLRAGGMCDEAAIRAAMMPALRELRRRRNRSGGYGVLAAEEACLAMLQVDRFALGDLNRVLLVSDGYYRLVDVYGSHSDRDLLQQTAEHGPQEMLAVLRAIEAADTQGEKHPRLKMADDATAVLLRRA